MPMFQVRTPLSPSSGMGDTMESENVAAEEEEKTSNDNNNQQRPSPQPAVQEAVFALESNGSCSPGRSFLQHQPSPSLSPAMHRAPNSLIHHDDAEFSISGIDHNILDDMAFFSGQLPATGEHDHFMGGDAASLGLQFDSQHHRTRSASIADISWINKPKGEEMAIQTDEIPPEERTTDDDFCCISLQLASTIDIDLSPGDKEIMVSSDIPFPPDVVRQKEIPNDDDGDEKKPAAAKEGATKNSDAAAVAAAASHETRSDTPCEAVAKDAVQENDKDGQNMTLASKSPRTDMEDGTEASEDNCGDQHVKDNAVDTKESPKAATSVAKGAVEDTEKVVGPKSPSFDDEKTTPDSSRKRLGPAFDKDAPVTSRLRKRPRTVTSDTVPSAEEAQAASGSGQSNPQDSANGSPRIAQAATGGSSHERDNKDKSQNSFTCEVPMSVKPGSWIQIEWPELVKGERKIYKFQCPEDYAESSNKDMKRILLVLDDDDDDDDDNDDDDDEEEEEEEKEKAKEEEQKYLKKVKVKKHSRVGGRYQISELPDIGSGAAEFDEIDEDDEDKIGYGVIWDPILAKQAEDRGEDLDGFVERAKKQGISTEESLILLHRCKYSVQEADFLLAREGIDALSDWAVHELSPQQEEVFKASIFRHFEDFQRIEDEVGVVNQASIMSHYYAKFYDTPDYKRLEKLINEHSDECCMCSDGGNLILCEGCKSWFHLACAEPPLDQVPKGDWLCGPCISSGNKKPPQQSEEG